MGKIGYEGGDVKAGNDGGERRAAQATGKSQGNLQIAYERVGVTGAGLFMACIEK
jgi:hypothetical protein